MLPGMGPPRPAGQRNIFSSVIEKLERTYMVRALAPRRLARWRAGGLLLLLHLAARWALAPRASQQLGAARPHLQAGGSDGEEDSEEGDDEEGDEDAEVRGPQRPQRGPQRPRLAPAGAAGACLVRALAATQHWPLAPRPRRTRRALRPATTTRRRARPRPAAPAARLLRPPRRSERSS
jgi:hypothetical protein